MSWKENYNDICTELRLAQIHELEMRKRVEVAHQVMVSGEMPSSGTYCHIPLDKGIAYYNAAVSALELAQAEVDRISAIKTEMEQAMAKFTGTAYVIQYKHIVEGKTYRQIGAELNMTEQSIKNLMHRKRNQLSTENANAS